MPREKFLFFKKLVQNPKSVGSIAPSSRHLGNFMGNLIRPGEKVIELGAGTGGLTPALIETGIDSKNLALLELDLDMHRLLESKFPNLLVMHGDAQHLPSLIRDHAPHMESVDVIVSGIPMMNLSFVEQSQIVHACFELLGENGRFIQFTYGPLSPLPSKKLGLKAKRLGYVLQNMPPAMVWQYTRHDSLCVVA